MIKSMKIWILAFLILFLGLILIQVPNDMGFMFLPIGIAVGYIALKKEGREKANGIFDKQDA